METTFFVGGKSRAPVHWPNTTPGISKILRIQTRHEFLIDIEYVLITYTLFNFFAANSSGTMFDVCQRLVPVMFTVYRIGFGLSMKSY